MYDRSKSPGASSDPSSPGTPSDKLPPAARARAKPVPPSTPKRFEASGPRVALYRLYTEHDLLLYIGITHDIGTRMAQHENRKPWWRLVTDIWVTWYPNRQAALDAERLAIKTEKPWRNQVHNGPTTWHAATSEARRYQGDKI